MSGHLHPNRVHVNELPVEVTKEELKQVFAQFNVCIRYTRIVQTGGETNYGFVTFDSKEEADRVILQGQSDSGIVVRGKRVPVNRAFSRRSPPRPDSTQFSNALQSMIAGNERLAPRMTTPHFMPSNQNYAYAPSVPNQRYANSAAQLPCSVQYNPFPCWSTPTGHLFMAPTNVGMQHSPGIQTAAQTVQYSPLSSFSPGATHGGAHSPSQWPMHGAQRFPFELAEATHSSGSMTTYLATPSPGYPGPMFVQDPLEGHEAPTLPQWSEMNKSAESSPAYHAVASQGHPHQAQYEVQQVAHQPPQHLTSHLAQREVPRTCPSLARHRGGSPSGDAYGSNK